jgi:hypothetical protein
MRKKALGFRKLKEKAPAPDQIKLTSRYKEEFERYIGNDGI